MTNKHQNTILALALVGGVALAQAPKSQALLMAMGANGKQIAAYQWKQKTTVLRGGNAVNSRLEEVRIDAEGQPQRMTLSQSEPKKMGPLRAHKAAEIKDDVQEVMRLASRYANPHQLAQAIQRGEIWEGQGALRVHAQSVIMSGDDLSLHVNGASYLPTGLDVRCMYEGHPITIAMDYQQLLNGPNVPARMTVRIPADDIVVSVDSFDYVRLAARIP